MVLAEGLLGGMCIDEVVGLGVESVVAQEFEQSSVIHVAAGPGGYVDLPGFAAELGGVDAGLDFEFLQSVHGGKHHVQVEIHIGIRDAVQGVVVPGGARAR